MTVTPTVEIFNRPGLHARASNAFARMAQEFESEIMVEREVISADARSIMELLSLAASKGCTIDISATGVDEEAALNALSDFVANRFGEED